MRTALLLFFLLLLLHAGAQITNPIIKAGFGVDADLRANFFNGFVQSGNDDWFANGTPGTGHFVIDTTGAAAIRNGYASDVSPFPRRMTSFYRTMSRPSFSVVNNRLWLDALFVRDYHGNDTTVFIAGSDKNGMSPANWSGGVQGIPDKNDILDMMMHVRRAGPTSTDSLWFFGGLSLDNVTGNRYFDFEMYQTDIYYDRASSRWFGFGPDAGHTSWQFDASGNILRPGDIIFSAEYQSSSLTNIEARIWVHRSALSTTPVAFAWSGQFDGDGSGAQYGYASILPKQSGTFYTGLQSGNSEWAGPFSLVTQSNAVNTTYAAKQYMEFSVNLTKLGLDPVTVFGTDICGTPFNRIVVKTRASASFTAELKDFVAPIDLFLAPRVNAIADVPIYCGSAGASNLQVLNPSSSSVYTWSTSNGNIVGGNTGPSVTANASGTYVVQQRLAAGCNVYATDTVLIVTDATCRPLDTKIESFAGQLKAGRPQLQWRMSSNEGIRRFVLLRSNDGRHFGAEATLPAGGSEASASYQWMGSGGAAYYRLAVELLNGQLIHSDILRMGGEEVPSAGPELYPNPAAERVQLVLPPGSAGEVQVVHAGGQVVYRKVLTAKGPSVLLIDVSQWSQGVYFVQTGNGQTQLRKKLLVKR